jgi:N-methylhydantoinase B
LFGGGPGARSKSVLRPNGEAEIQIPSKLEFTMDPGDVLDVWTTGGGGYGDPLERAPDLVLADVLDRKVSLEAAKADYGVVIAGRALDEGATAALRAKLRSARGPITWHYDRGPLGRE